MKIKCDEHQRRVLVLASKTLVHREDGSICDSKTIYIGGKTLDKKNGWAPLHREESNGLNVVSAEQ